MYEYCEVCREHNCWASSNRVMNDFLMRGKIHNEMTYWEEQPPVIVEAVPGSLYDYNYYG